jgi:hypothetical protein
VADVRGYGASYLVGAIIHALALPFVYLARRQDAAGEQAEVVARPELTEVNVPRNC